MMVLTLMIHYWDSTALLIKLSDVPNQSGRLVSWSGSGQEFLREVLLDYLNTFTPIFVAVVSNMKDMRSE